MKKLISAMVASMLLGMTSLASAAPAAHHPAPGSDAETADLNAQSLQKARASLPPQAASTARPVAASGHPVQAAGTGETASPIRVPETGSTVSGY